MDVSTGFNGFARKVIDSCERLNNRDLKLRITLHAEENAILFANKSLEGHQIFTYPFQPCAHCASIIIQKGIIRVVTLSGYPERWEKDFLISKELFKETGVDLVFYDALELID
jgi:dCMP deaminase